MDSRRREFLKICGGVGALGALTVIGIGCDSGGDDGGGGPTGPSQSDCNYTVDGEGRVVLDITACGTLQENNSAIALTGTSRGTLLVTHTSGNSYYALSNVCTHQSCGVNATTPTLNCPCHGSRYNLNGSVAQGPATRALASYPVVKDGNNLLISFG